MRSIYQKIKEKILSVFRIEDVIGDFVELRKSGMNYRGLSPFSDEKNPSFIVSPMKKIWKDFSSGKGGDVIHFLMEHERFSYVESLFYLAKKYNIKINSFKKKKIEIEEEKLIKKLYHIQNGAKFFFIHQMFNTKEGLENGLNYLIQKRKFNIEIIHKFELGYAPMDWRVFTKKFFKKGFHLSDLIQSGLTFFSVKKKKYFDRFRKRIIFPIYNLSGNVIGFGGRMIILDSNHFNVKYINSSESDIFHKREVLYGLFQSKNFLLKENLCYLVEGYTDVLSLYQSGIKNTVSSFGISLTIKQILLIKKFTKNIILFYDGDTSGIKATLRIINLILEQGMNLRILFCSNGEDPDSISKKNYSLPQLRKFFSENSYNFISFKERIYRKIYKNDPLKKSLVLLSILKNISKIKNNLIQRELYLQETSNIFKISKEILHSELEKMMTNYHEKKIIKKKDEISLKQQENYSLKQQENSMIFIENKLIELILKYGNKIIKKRHHHDDNTTVFKEILSFLNCWNIKLFSSKNQKILDQISLNFNSHSPFFLEKDHQFNKLDKLSKWDKKGIFVPSEEERIEKYLDEVILRYKSLFISKRIEKEIHSHHDENHDNRKFFLKKIIFLTHIRNKINKKLHREV